MEEVYTEQHGDDSGAGTGRYKRSKRRTLDTRAILASSFRSDLPFSSHTTCPAY